MDYVVPDTDEDVDEDTVQSWTMENEEEVDNSPTVEKVLDIRQGVAKRIEQGLQATGHLPARTQANDTGGH